MRRNGDRDQGVAEATSRVRMPLSLEPDLLASVRIVLPEGSDPELETLMRKWRESKAYDPRPGPD